MLAIRSYAPEEPAATIEIFLRAFREVACMDYTSDQIEAWAQVKDREAWAMRRASRPTWIVAYDGDPAGFSDLEPSAHLDMMVVHPGHQGLA